MPSYKRLIQASPLKTVLLYAAVSTIYIYCSDYFLQSLVDNAEVLTRLQTYKGVGFVMITAILLYFLVKANIRAVDEKHQLLSEKEKVYRTLIENNNDIVVQLDSSRKIIFSSNNLESITGYTPSEFNAFDFSKIVEKEDCGYVESKLREVFANPRELINSEFRIHTKSGRVIWMESSMADHSSDPLIQGIIINARDITERKESEKRHREAEEQYWSLFNKSPLPMWIFDEASLRFLLVNEAAIRLYGYSKEEYLQMTLKDIRYPEDIPEMEKMLAFATLHERTVLEKVLRHKRRNGDIIVVKIENARIDFDGNSARLVLATDMTAEHEMQKKLQEINRKLKSASEIAKLGYWQRDFATGAIEWSDELYQIFEVDPDTFELTLENIKECCLPEDREHFSIDLDTYFAGNHSREIEHKIFSRNGKGKWISEQLNLVKDELGNPLRLEGVVLDIDSRKQYEKAIEESNERFRMVMTAAVEAIIDWDIVHNSILLGDGFRELFGHDTLSENSVIWAKNIHPDDRPRVLADLKKVLADPTQKLFYAEFRFLKASGEVAYVQHRGIFVRDVHGRATRAVGAMIDVTESMEKMHKIEQQNAALREIAWIQSHIVRAPLATLLGLVDLLRLRDGLKENDLELINHIFTSAKRLDEVIRSIVHKSEKVNVLAHIS